MKLLMNQVEAIGSGAIRVILAVPLYAIAVGLGAGCVWGFDSGLLLYWWPMLVLTLTHPIGFFYYPITILLVYRMFDDSHSLLPLCAEVFALNLWAAFVLRHLEFGLRAFVIGLALVGFVGLEGWLRVQARRRTGIQQPSGGGVVAHPPQT